LEIWVVIRHIKSTGIASIIVDKDINALLPICDRNYILNKGEVVYHGKSRELLENPQLHKHFLGV
ncbi:MAG: ABC transporter ATP-binding protein, partial [Sedimenticola sp.]|nr:ABC transporter ATP-binding protein [Sedimenticola sp.]MCW8947921.1 ABC transporter ATP-binding protein [Sedimenticola sp.]